MSINKRLNEVLDPGSVAAASALIAKYSGILGGLKAAGISLGIPAYTAALAMNPMGTLNATGSALKTVGSVGLNTLKGLGVAGYKAGEFAVNKIKDYRDWAKKMDDEEAARVAAMKAMPQKKRKKKKPKKPSQEKLQYMRASRTGITGRLGQRVLMTGNR